MLKKIFIIFIITIMLFLTSICLATTDNLENNEDTGIMPLASIDDSNFDENNNLTIDYTFHSTNQVFKGSVTVPNSIKKDFNSWCLFINTDGNPILFGSSSADNCYRITRYRSDRSGYYSYYVYLTNSAMTSSSSFYYYLFNSSSNEWTFPYSSSPVGGSYPFDLGYQGCEYIYPSSFLYAVNADVTFCSSTYTKYSGGNSPTLESIKNKTFVPVNACRFETKSPHLILLDDNKFQVALGTTYDGYIYDGGTIGCSIIQTICENLLIYIYDMDESTETYKYYLSLSSLTDNIKDSSEHGKILELNFAEDFDENFFTVGHHYSFAFSIVSVNTVQPPRF